MRRYLVEINGKKRTALVHRREGSKIHFSIDSKEFKVDVAPIRDDFQTQGTSPAIPQPVKTEPSPSSSAPGDVIAPMPGIIVNIPVKKGDVVKAGDTVCIMEAMKMENNIAAPSAGTIAEIHVKASDEVQNGQLLVSLAAE